MLREIVMFVLLTSVALGLAIGGWYGAIWFLAWLETKAAPRKEMYVCDKHGPLLKEHCIDFMGQTVCPICFHGRLQAAERSGQQSG